MDWNKLKELFKPEYVDTWIIILGILGLTAYVYKIWFITLPFIIMAGLLYMKKYGKKTEANS